MKEPVFTKINPSDIQDFDLSNIDIKNDPDYTSLGWGITPASVNYIGIIPYLIKSNQEQQILIEQLRNDLDSKNAQFVTIEQRLSALENP